MSLFFSNNKYKYSIIDSSYRKTKLNSLFLNSKFIIYMSLPLKNNFFFKNKILSYNLLSLNLEKKYIKALFNSLNFSFLAYNNYLCIFINDNIKFIEIIKIIESKQFYYSYKNCFSNIVFNKNILEEYNKYNINYIYIQFILKKIKIKIIFLLLFFLISLVKYMK
jgi:hypothetical protein